MTAPNVVYLMRGLPSTGKSHAARRLAGENGVVCETDAYFYTEVGDDPNSYDYDASLLATARKWNVERFVAALEAGRSPVVVDRGNGLSLSSQIYVRQAVDHDYMVELREPDSPWWTEISVLLKYRDHNGPILDRWAVRLSEMNQETHRTSAREIRRRMAGWKQDLTVEDILRYQPRRAITQTRDQEVAPEDEIVIPMRHLMVGATPEMGAVHQEAAGLMRTRTDTSDGGDVLIFDEQEGEFGYD